MTLLKLLVMIKYKLALNFMFKWRVTDVLKNILKQNVYRMNLCTNYTESYIVPKTII